MNAIDAAIFLGERLGRERALHPDETDALQAVIRIIKPTRIWTSDMDRRLIQERYRNPRSYANIIAVEFGVSSLAVRKRAQKLKARERI